MARYAFCRYPGLDRSGIFLMACPANCARVSAAPHVDELHFLRPDTGVGLRMPAGVVLAAWVRHAGHVLVGACRDVVPASARMVRGRPGELAG